MNKFLKIGLTIIGVIILLGLLDFASIKLLKRPLLARETVYDKYNKMYESLLYNAYYCGENNQLHVIKKSDKFMCFVESKPSFKIVDESKICAEALEEIYRDKDYIYYLPCIKSSMIYIIFDDDENKYSLKYVLDNEKLTIDELVNNGLKVYKEEINE